MEIRVDGKLSDKVTAKDIILAIIGKFGTAGATGYVIEYRGSAIQALSMEARMTICNMSIEAGARAGLIAPDETTFNYIQGKDFSPKGVEWDLAVKKWKHYVTDEGAKFDRTVILHADEIAPMVTWGTSPSQVVSIKGVVPDPKDANDPVEKIGFESALNYMDLKSGQKIEDISINKVFIGSCTNSRIED